MCTIFFHFIRDKLESFPHAILNHLLFGFFGFFEFFYKCGDNIREQLMLILMIMPEDLSFELILIFVKVHNKILDEFPES